jgi:hypothetical protein
MMMSQLKNEALLESVLNSALMGLETFVMNETLNYPAGYRLAFRELGLSIGLSGVENLQKWSEENSSLFSRESSVHQRIEDLMEYAALREKIERFWMDDENRKASTWISHREINMVMLATSLAPGRFLMI